MAMIGIGGMIATGIATRGAMTGFTTAAIED